MRRRRKMMMRRRKMMMRRRKMMKNMKTLMKIQMKKMMMRRWRMKMSYVSAVRQFPKEQEDLMFVVTQRTGIYKWEKLILK